MKTTGSVNPSPQTGYSKTAGNNTWNSLIIHPVGMINFITIHDRDTGRSNAYPGNKLRIIITDQPLILAIFNHSVYPSYFPCQIVIHTAGSVRLINISNINSRAHTVQAG